jgi:hypothetical protein
MGLTALVNQGKKLFQTPQPQQPPQPPSRPGQAAPPLTFSGFDCLPPDPAFAGQRTPSWWSPGVHVPLIRAERGLPFVDLAPRMVELIKHCWKNTAVSDPEQRGRLFVGTGGTRPQHLAGQFQNHGYAKQVTPLSSVSSIAEDWTDLGKIPRVNAYTFRGDHGRTPRDIEKAGGFHPPVTRTDSYYVNNFIYPRFSGYMQRRFNVDISKEQFARIYAQKVVLPEDRLAMRNYFVWRSLVEQESHHVVRMVADETLMGYISTSSSIGVAMGFATRGANDGWVYVTRVRGGFRMDKRATAKDYAEHEIAFPGTLAWSDVFGFRKYTKKTGFEGPIYVRQAFAAQNAKAYQQIFELLSGKDQSTSVPKK